MHTASLHIPSILRWPGTYSSVYGSRTASLHISCVLKRSETRHSWYGYKDTVLVHISCVLRWSGASLSMYRLWVTALIHTSWMIYQNAFLNKSLILFNHPGLDEDQILWTEKMIKDTSINVFIPIYSALIIWMHTIPCSRILISRPFNQRFIAVYPPLIFVCMAASD